MTPRPPLASVMTLVVAGARIAEVNYRLVRAIADADARPTWHDGDFFGEIFPAPR